MLKDRRAITAGMLILGIAVVAALCGSGCKEAPKTQEDPWRLPPEKVEWEVDTILGAPDTTCPCCPIAIASEEASTMSAFTRSAKYGEPGCCPCMTLLKSKDGRRWQTYWEKRTPTSYESSKFHFYTSAAVDPGCPCCPIALLALYGARRGPDTCCVCDFYAVSGTQIWRDNTPLSITDNPQDVLETEVICPVAGQLHVTATCDIKQSQGGMNPVDVFLQISAGDAMLAAGQDGDAGQSWSIAPGSEETGYTTTVTLRRDFDVMPGKVPVTLNGNTGADGMATGIGLRSLDITFVPAADAGPVGSE
jgi:hypothetical protein